MTDDEDRQWVRVWKRDRLAPLASYLDDSWKAIYADLIANTGQPEHPEFVSYTKGPTFGPHSPITREELREKSPQQVVEYLDTQQLTGDPFHGPSIEGLARELTATVAEKCEEYTVDVAKFKRLAEPTYVRALIQGFHQALKDKRKFPWGPVLNFCEWAVRQKREMPNRSTKRLEMDPHWGWTRVEVVRLLATGLASGENPIPLELRKQTWRAIKPVTEDPDPAPEQERRYLQNAAEKRFRSHPYANAINSVRGEAMATVVKYSLWVRKESGKLGNGDAQLVRGFGAMPEVKKVLESHLNMDVDPSITIRTVYGAYLPWLQLLDRTWVEENVSRIFPKNRPQFWHAVWDTYICHCAAYDDVFKLLNREYTFAIGQIGNHEHGWENSEAPDYALAQHLMAFYWRGKLDYQSDLIGGFYGRADGKLCGQALNFVGWSLRNTKDPIQPEVAQRLKLLLEKRVEAARSHPEGAVQELSEYGWWFSSGKFDDDWAINRLLDVLRLAKVIKPDHMVVERIADLSRSYPLRCIEALTLIVQGDTKRWGILGWRDKAKEIIRAVRSSDNQKACKKAEDLVNYLGSLGYFDFGELLTNPTG